MSFYAKKLDKKLLLHVSSHTDKKEIKKELNKLAKIQLKADKYLVVESLPDL
jgi:predicted Zn-ribbon and HTH transcriptional regulator